MKKIVSIDVETNGLYGQPFAIAAQVWERRPKRELWGSRSNYIRAHEDVFIRFLEQGESVPEPKEFGPEYSGTWAAVTSAREWREIHGFAIEKRQFEWVKTDAIGLRLPDSAVDNEWVAETVLPALAGMPVTHDNYEAMLADFAAWYMENKEDAFIVAHMGAPVEAFLFREMVRIGDIGQFDGPYPLHDAASMLFMADENPTSVDEYAAKYDLKPPVGMSVHNPMYDAEVTAKVTIHLSENRKNRKHERGE